MTAIQKWEKDYKDVMIQYLWRRAKFGMDRHTQILEEILRDLREEKPQDSLGASDYS